MGQGAKISKFVVHAPLIAFKAQPGQFVVVMVTEFGERIPLTVVDTNKDDGHVVLIAQEIGFSTKLLGKLNTGQTIYAIAGPMGHATPIKKYGKVNLVAGGVGIAEIDTFRAQGIDVGGFIVGASGKSGVYDTQVIGHNQNDIRAGEWLGYCRQAEKAEDQQFEKMIA